MTILVLNILLLLFWKGVVLDRGTQSSRRLFCFMAGLQWFLIMSLRAWDVGGDASQYLYLYNVSSLYGVSHTLHNMYDLFLGALDGLDPGFDLLVYKPAQSLNLGYQFALVTHAALVTAPLSRFIYKHSRDCCLSFLVFGTIFLGVIGLAGMRQSLAMSLLVFLGYDLILGRRLIPFLLLVVACYTIHQSAIIFLPFYFLSRLHLTSIKSVFLLVDIAALVPFAGMLAPYLYALVGYDDYGYSYVGGSNFVYVVMFTLLAVFVAFRIKPITFIDENGAPSTVALYVVLSAMPFTFVNSNTMRAAWYYMLFLILLVPLIVESYDVKTRRLLYLGVFAVCVVALLLTGGLVLPDRGYTFFWMG